MTALEQLLASEGVSRFGWTLFHSLWEMAIVALLVAVALRLLRPASASVRYLVACAGLAAMFVPAGVTYALLARDAQPTAVALLP